MAFDFTDVNLTPATGAVAIYNLKQRLKAQGWTVPRSSDGTTYNSSGDQITTGAAGAGGMANNSAWFIIQAPAGGRQFCFQRGTTNVLWRILYSFSAAFTGGSPGATRVSTATDQQFLCGGGTDASPTYYTLFGTADGGWRHHIAVDGASPYGWYSVGYPTGGGGVTHGLFMDPLTQTAGGATPDVDAYCFYANGRTTENMEGGALIWELTSGQGPAFVGGYLKKGLAGEGWVMINALSYYIYSGTASMACIPDASNLVAGTGLGINPHTGLDDIFDILYGRRSGLAAPFGYKGKSTLLKWTGKRRLSGDTLSVASAGAKDYIVIGHVALPWNGSTPSV